MIRKPSPRLNGVESSLFLPFHLLLLLFLISLLLQPLVEPDFGWHLRAGLDMVKNGWRVPATDPYSHTVPDWPWVEHAWLTDIILALIYQGLGSLGTLGVIVFFAAVTGAAFAVAVSTASAGTTWKLLSLCVTLWIALPFLGARTQMVSLLGLALLLRLFAQYRSGLLRHLWALPLLFALWANLHGGFTAGLFALAVLLAGSVLLRWLVDRRGGIAGSAGPRLLDEPVLNWSQIKHVALILTGSMLVTLINPYGWHLYQEIVSSLSDRFMIQTLREWHPVSLETRAGRWYVAYVLLLGLTLIPGYRRREPLRWLMVGTFLILSFRHLRNIPFFLVLGTSLYADGLAALAARLVPTAGRTAQRIKSWMLGGVFGAALGLVALGPDHLNTVVRCAFSPAEYFATTEYPIEVVSWIRAHRPDLGTRLYNDYGMGGFLLWWLPEEKVFIDGRMPAWRVGDRWIFYDYMALTSRDPPDLGVLLKYRVDWAIVTAGTPLAHALAGRSEWQEVYQDGKVGLYVKKRV